MKRREFISKGALGLGIPFLGNGILPSSTRMLDSILANTELANDHVLVMINLVGGNDGLNTIIPQDFGNLWVSRNSILPDDKLMHQSKIDNRIAFNPAIKGIRDLFDQRKLTLIQGVGYPDANFSHFKSSDIWMTGSNSNQTLTTGWIGRFLDTQFKNFPLGYPNSAFPHPPSIITGGAIPVLMQGEKSTFGTAINDLSNFITLNENPFISNSEGKIKEELTFIKNLYESTNKYSSEIKKGISKVGTQKDYPNTALGLQLKNIAKMIASGLKTKIYHANQTGYDTHANQVSILDSNVGVHASLLQNLSEAITAFMADLKFLGINKRVIGLTYSEFGRRIIANASKGTDHGTAAPMFVFGDQAVGGMIGNNPFIEKNNGPESNIPMQYDYRSVYASILKDWFCVSQNVLNEIFFKNYQQLPIVANFDCLGITNNEANENINQFKPDDKSGSVQITSTEKTLLEEQRLSIYPNPFQNKVKIEFESNGGHCLVQVFNTLGQIVSIVLDGNYIRGFYKVNFDGSNLPDGAYHVRFQNKSFQKVLNTFKISN